MSFNVFSKFRSGIFYGWRMVGLVSIIRIVGGGLHQVGFTVFFLPISQDLGISRAATSLAFSLSRAQGAIEAPLAGPAIVTESTATFYLDAGWVARPGAKGELNVERVGG